MLSFSAVRPSIRAKRLFTFLTLVLLCFSAKAQVSDLPFDGGSPTRTLLAATQSPKALVILLIGGDGKVGIFNNGTARSTHTFVRSQEFWAQYGIDSVLVDSRDFLVTRDGDRLSNDYQNRLLSVVNYYKNKMQLPIWLFGHSNGTISVAEFVNRFGKQNVIAGFIVAGTEKTAILKDDSSLPALAIHHSQDSCSVTPISASQEIIKSRPKGTRAEFITIDGGVSTGNVCWSLAYHGFNQRENEMVKVAAEFILKK